MTWDDYGYHREDTMKGMYVCELCKKQGKETKIPADEVGAALMESHLKAEHGVRVR